MSESIYSQLIKDHPLLYSKHFYFECGPGWYDLIRNLSIQLSQHLEEIKSLNPSGYQEFLRDHRDPKTPDELPTIVAQVKEKFGGLRFYVNYSDRAEMNKLIDLAEKLSFKICEECGKKGKRRGKRWIQTLCWWHHLSNKIHFKKRIYITWWNWSLKPKMKNFLRKII
jgi:hypothetical protein